MKTVLINPATNREKTLGQIKEIHGRTTMMPLNIAYLAAYLRRDEMPVEIIDAYAENLSLEETVRRTLSKHADVAGITCVTPTMPFVNALAERLKERNPAITVVAGGAHPTVLPEETLAHVAIDVVVRNEGEITLRELIGALAAQKPLADVAGISYRDGSRIVNTPARPLVTDLDALPFPAFDLLPMHLYKAPPHWEIAAPAFQMLTSRGCPFNCIFCGIKALGRKVRTRSIGNVIAEIEYLRQQYAAREVMFVDPTFPFSRQRMVEFCDMLIARGLHDRIVWVTETRVDMVDEDLLRRMRRAGCRLIGYGIESGSPVMLERMRKGFSKDQAQVALEATRRAGILSYCTFIFGLPGETETQMRQTIEFAKQLDPDYVKFNLAVPYPGSDFYAAANTEGGLKFDAWDEFTSFSSMTDADPVYVPGTVSAARLQAIHKQAYRAYYLRPKIVWRNLRRIRSAAELKKYLDLGVLFVRGVLTGKRRPSCKR